MSVVSDPVQSTADLYHHCNACGACCDSAPQLTVRELFYHRRRFIGCLAIQRVPRIVRGLALRHGRICDEKDESVADELAARIFHRHPSHNTHEILLCTRAFSYRSGQRCPALSEDRRCAIHGDAKPNVCLVVPFDALRPDRLQEAVLQSRRGEFSALGSDCIRAEHSDGFDKVVRRLQVVDDRAAFALQMRRNALESERKLWGVDVFKILTAEILNHAHGWSTIPEQGDFTMSIVPVLQALLKNEPDSRTWVLEYLADQIELMQTTIAGALLLQNRADRSETAQLRAFLRSNQRLREHLSLVTA